jgi:predicted MFS family arabinose efflux permease
MPRGELDWLVTADSSLGGNLTAVALTACTSPTMLTVVWYVREQPRLPPARASLLFPAFNLAVTAGALADPRLLPRPGTGPCSWRVSPPSPPPLLGKCALAGQ